MIQIGAKAVLEVQAYIKKEVRMDKISYKTLKNNKTLEEFIPKKEVQKNEEQEE